LPETVNRDGFGAISACAAEVVGSGTCGDNLTWVLDDEGTLTISGTGDMNDYMLYVPGPYDEGWETYVSSPWWDNTENIVTVIIEDVEERHWIQFN